MLSAAFGIYYLALLSVTLNNFLTTLCYDEFDHPWTHTCRIYIFVFAGSIPEVMGPEYQITVSFPDLNIQA